MILIGPDRVLLVWFVVPEPVEGIDRADSCAAFTADMLSVIPWATPALNCEPTWSRATADGELIPRKSLAALRAF